MDDEYDIYGDLDGFEVEAQKENKIIKDLNGEIEQLKGQIERTESEKAAITRKNEILLQNISSLLLTAKAELKRKDSLIADIRREKDDVAFRRAGGPRSVKKHDRGTQTVWIRTMHREVQTDVVPAAGSGRRYEEVRRDKHRSRSRSREDRPRIRERLRSRSRSRDWDRPRPGGDRPRLSDRLQKRLGWTKETKLAPERSRERERERERRARREPHSPEVRFHSPIRVGSKHQEVGVADSASDIDLVKGFIPMNRVELDRFVKEIGRKESRSPEGCYPGGGGSGRVNNVITSPDSELYDATQTKKVEPEIERQTPQAEDSTEKQNPPTDAASRKQEEIIQSDEIGTTGNGPTLSPEKSEDLERKMLALHGEPMASIRVPVDEYLHQTSAELLEGLQSKDDFDTSQPAKFVIPPPEPPIIEQVPEIPLDDDLKLNDSRELRIIESDEIIAVEREDEERNSSAETVIENNQAAPVLQAVAPAEEEELEDGEVVTPAESEAEDCDQIIERTAKRVTKTDSKIRQESKTHRITDKNEVKNVLKKSEEPSPSQRRRHSCYYERSSPRKHDLNQSHKPNISHPPLDTSTPNRSSSISTRRLSVREKPSTDKVDRTEARKKPEEPKASQRRRHNSHSEKSSPRKYDLSQSHKPNLSHPPLDTSTPNRTSSISTRRKSTREKSSTDKVEPKPSHHHPEPVRSSQRQKILARRKSTSLKDLFGSDYERSPAKDSLAKRKLSPEKMEVAKKRKVNDARVDRTEKVTSLAAPTSQQQSTSSQPDAVKKVPKEADLPPETSPVETGSDATASKIVIDEPEPCAEPVPKQPAPIVEASPVVEIQRSTSLPDNKAEEPREEDSVNEQKADRSITETSPAVSLPDHSTGKIDPCAEPPPEQPATIPPASPIIHNQQQSTSQQITSPQAKESPKTDPVDKQKEDRPPVETSPVVSFPADHTASKSAPKEPEPRKEPLAKQPEPTTPAPPTAPEHNSTSPQVITYSNKYSEYRVEVNSEAEATIYITRKKKKKRKSNTTTTPNASLVDPA